MTAELFFRIGDCYEKQAARKEALAAYQRAAGWKVKNDPFRISAVARCAMLYEETEEYAKALAAYRDLAANGSDPELVAAASDRASELASVVER
jgi:tetratricopeptide (TPR) repeat protein